MLCKIADLIAEVPDADGLAVRCRDYLYNGISGADITIRTDLYRRDQYDPRISAKTMAYMESAAQFYRKLLAYDGFYLHASAVVRDGKAYLFSGPSGAGKSTHTRLWLDTFGGDTRVINDDKPALRCLNGVWYAYGTPWCGKDGINRNEKAPLAGVCFLKKGADNRIRRLTPQEAMTQILRQTLYRLEDVEQADALLHHLGAFLERIPIYELENRPEPSAARLSYETMLLGAQEASL